ncbi:MAG TPA: cytosine deaminase [Geminicoccus sp.]|jgi:cytosine deaminase|uniref:cytosine deaminase n=1 Tax=Geminicoccus sp. TaxID=2024832 RepID=UPI002E2FD0CC|nr:cytosine deaminase [Geminicoccus sp.]HEX2527130.1 cytosine deaminase [Geminicoccus sp.]
MKLVNLTLPGRSGRYDLLVEGGRIASLGPHSPDGSGRDLAGRMVWPCPIDLHTHLDKGHITPRRPNPDGSFPGALEAVHADHERWTAADVTARMTFSLQCAYAHGTRAIRTHLDSLGDLPRSTWPAFTRVAEEWAGRIDLQAVCLVPTELYDGTAGMDLVRLVAEHGGLLGGFPLMTPDVERQLACLFDLAGRHGLDVDLHVDESMDPSARVLDLIADAVRSTGFDRPVVCGHCCSLAVQDEATALRTLDKVADAGLAIVSLPMCNMYLQDRTPGRTPRLRGVTLVHEARARGIPVAFGSDNTRDPFYAYGDLDPVEVFREAVRIAQLDHPFDGWLDTVTTTPARLMGTTSQIVTGGPADFIILEGRSFSEVLSRPQVRRQVVRQGQFIEAQPPLYELLDPIVGVPV